MKNKDNIVPPQRFNPPTPHGASLGGGDIGTCFVYEPSAYRNLQRRKPSPTPPPEKFPAKKVTAIGGSRA